MTKLYTPGEPLLYKYIDWERSASATSYKDVPCTFVRYGTKNAPIVLLNGQENWIYDERKLRRPGEEDRFNPRGTPKSNIVYPEPYKLPAKPDKPTIALEDLSLDSLGL